MSVDGDLLEQIVAGVLRELHGQDEAARPSESTVPVVPNEIVLTEKVVTADLLKKRCRGAAKLVVGRNAVMTPSARDFLRQNKVEIHRVSPAKHDGSTSKVATTANWKLIVVHMTKTLSGVLDDAARWPGVVWLRELAGCDIDAADRAVSTLCRGESDGVMVFTRRPEVVACRGNRNVSVRGVAIDNVARVQAARKQMGANLYCIDSEARSQSELNNLLREVAISGRPQQPESWKE